MRLSYEEQVKGRTVIDGNGLSIGEVDAIYLDPESIERGGLRVSAIRVKLHAEVADAIGVSRGTFRAGSVDVPATALRALGDAVLLDVAVGSLVHRTAAEPADAP
jgi:sporulation protein YlmC with PRC-barrel domain